MADNKRSSYWFFKNVYNSSEIKFLNKHLLEKITSEKDRPSPNVTKTSSVHIVSPHGIKITDRMYNCLHGANRLNFGYVLYMERSDMHYNVYSSTNKGKYDYHTDMDFNNPASDIKLTGIINLSMKKYTGGKLYLNPFGNSFEVTELSSPGTMVIFPSFFLHKISPVLTGERISLVLWGNGPKFQ